MYSNHLDLLNTNLEQKVYICIHYTKITPKVTSEYHF